MPPLRNELRILDISDRQQGAVFKAALGICGFSYLAYSEFCNETFSADQVKKWAQGQRGIPEFAWMPLAEIYDQIVAVSESALDMLEVHDVNIDSIQALASEVSGRPLPTEGAVNSALAMFMLARIGDGARPEP